MWTCPNCGIQNEDSFGFCPDCGTAKPVSSAALSEEACWFCPNCGTKNEEGYLFCLSCGTAKPVILVSEEPMPVPDEPTPVSEEPAPAQEEPTPVSEGPAPAQEEPTSGKKPVKKALWLILAGLAAAAVLVVLLLKNMFVSPEKLLAKGDAALAEGSFRQAEEYYEKYAEKSDLSQRDLAKLLDEIYLAEAKDEIRDGQWTAALELLDKVSVKDVSSYQTKCRLALADDAVQSGNWSLALELLGQCPPADAAALTDACYLGQAKEAMVVSSWDEALALLELCTVSDPAEEKAECLYGLALRCMEEADWEGALGYLEGLDVDDSDALRDQCRQQLSCDADFLSSFTDALLDYMDADKGTPAAWLLSLEQLQDVIAPFQWDERGFFREGLSDLASDGTAFLQECIDISNDLLAGDEMYYYYQYKLWTGLSSFYALVNSAADEYGLLAAEPSAAGFYRDGAEKLVRELVVINEFYTSFLNYRSKYSASSGTLTKQMFKYQSDLPYDVNVTFHIWLYDTAGKFLKDSTVTMDLPAGKLSKIYFDSLRNSISHREDWYINFD